MLRFVSLIVAVLFLVQSSDVTVASDKVIAIPKGPDLIIPAASPLTIKSAGPYTDAEFDGKVVVSGTYYYGRDKQYPNGEFDLTFVPSSEAYAVLPYFKGYRHLEEIVISNRDDFIRTVIPQDKLAALRKKHWCYVTGKIVIWADHFSVSVECDSPNDAMRFLSIYRAEPVQIAQSREIEGC